MIHVLQPAKLPSSKAQLPFSLATSSWTLVKHSAPSYVLDTDWLIAVIKEASLLLSTWGVMSASSFSSHLAQVQEFSLPYHLTPGYLQPHHLLYDGPTSILGHGKWGTHVNWWRAETSLGEQRGNPQPTATDGPSSLAWLSRQQDLLMKTGSLRTLGTEKLSCKR